MSKSLKRQYNMCLTIVGKINMHFDFGMYYKEKHSEDIHDLIHNAKQGTQQYNFHYGNNHICMMYNY